MGRQKSSAELHAQRANELTRSLKALGWLWPTGLIKFHRVEQERRSTYLYLAVCLGLVILLAVVLLLWLAASRGPAVAPITVIFPPPGSGRVAHLNSKAVFVALVTNTTSGRIVLDTQPMLLVEGGMAIPSMGLWGGTNFSCNLGPGQVVSLPVVIPTNSTKFRINFGYSADAKGLQRMVSPVCRSLLQPGKIPVSQNFMMRLFEQGWLDGRLHLIYQSGWETNW